MGLALWALCLVSTAVAHGPRTHHPATGTPPPAAVGVLSATADPAVVPPLAADELRVAATGGPLRLLVLLAALAGLVRLPAVLRRRLVETGLASKPLRSRRYAIALRAPPLQLA